LHDGSENRAHLPQMEENSAAKCTYRQKKRKDEAKRDAAYHPNKGRNEAEDGEGSVSAAGKLATAGKKVREKKKKTGGVRPRQNKNGGKGGKHELPQRGCIPQRKNTSSDGKTFVGTELGSPRQGEKLSPTLARRPPRFEKGEKVAGGKKTVEKKKKPETDAQEATVIVGS